MKTCLELVKFHSQGWRICHAHTDSDSSEDMGKLHTFALILRMKKHKSNYAALLLIPDNSSARNFHVALCMILQEWSQIVCLGLSGTFGVESNSPLEVNFVHSLPQSKEAHTGASET